MEELRIKLKFKALLVSIYIFPWISQYITRVTGIQMFTLAVAIMGSYQIFLRVYRLGIGLAGRA